MATYIDQKAEDAASADADLGFQALAVRKATPANTSGTDGDYEFLQISAGRLWVSANIDTIAGTAPTTVGKLDVKGADGDVFVRQTTASSLNAAVVGIGTAGSPSGNILTIQGVASMTKLLVTPDSVALPANQSVDVAQIAGTTTVTGGVAGILAVGGNVANAVTATANPVPVGGIFTTTPATLTTGQTATLQFTAAQNVKLDLTTIAGTVPTTAGFIDIKGADGNVFVRQATATNLKTQAECYMGGVAVAAGAPLQVSVANTGANATAVKVNVASGGIASGAIASGAVASGAVASGAVASGAFASGSISSGAIASGAIASGAIAVGAIAAGATSIATTEDSASAGADHLVKIAHERLDTPVANANVSNDGDYLQALCDNFGKLWVAGTVPEDTAHIASEPLTVLGARRIDTAATSSGASGDWSTVDASAEGALWATLTPTTTSGVSVGNFTSGDTYTALTNSAQAIKASAGNFYGYYIFNPNTAAAYVMVYNIAAASVTVGTSTAILVFCIPASSGANLSLAYPISFGTAMSIAAATTGGGNTAPTTALEAMVWYK